MPHRRRRGTPAYEDDGIQARVDAEPGGTHDKSDHASAGKTDFTIDGISASVDTESLMYSFDDASATKNTLVSAKGNIDSIPIQCSARTTLEDPVVGSKCEVAPGAGDQGPSHSHRRLLQRAFRLRALMCTPTRFVDMKIAYAYSSTDYKISSASDATFKDVSYDKA